MFNVIDDGADETAILATPDSVTVDQAFLERS
jgi:hypothetical protein